jgi:small conductance mechanosensitive channel
MTVRATFMILTLGLLLGASPVAVAQQVTPDNPNSPAQSVEVREPSSLDAAGDKAASASDLTDIPVSTGVVKAAADGPSGKLVSEAEQITRLKRAIEADKLQLEALRKEFEDPQNDYHKAEEEFHKIEEEHDALVKRIKELQEAGTDNERIAELEQKREPLARSRKLAQERFEILIEERKVNKEGMTTLEAKLAQEQQALDRLMGETPVAAPVTPPTAPAPSDPATAARSADPASAASSTTPPVLSPAPPSSAAAVAPTAAAAPVVAAPTLGTAGPAPMPVSPAAPADSPAGASPGSMVPASAAPPSAVQTAAPSKELVEAQVDEQKKAETARTIEAEARAITDRMSTLDKTIQQEQSLLQNAQRKADNANESRSSLAKELQEKSIGGAPATEIQELIKGLREAESRFREARMASRERSDRLDQLQTERAGLQAEQLQILRATEDAREQLEIAQATIEKLQNPLALPNVLRWLGYHGPRLLVILFGMFLLQFISRLFSHRIVHWMSTSGMWGTRKEREDRAQTLVGVFRNTALVVIWGGGVLMMLQEIGIPIAPLMGGAAVVGLAVAFGAQNLIRDFFYGFVILLENQYNLNDVIQIGELSGQVEEITLRVTVLRDIEGRVHFIPNGEVTSVTNFTHGWSRALFDIGVAYKEDPDQVMQVIQEIGRDLRRDPIFGLMILEDLTMLGVEQLADSAVVIRFYIKTRPLQQWSVKREMLLRIKRRFAKLGIEIPFPHRTVYHHIDEAGQNALHFGHSPSKPAIRVAGAGD